MQLIQGISLADANTTSFSTAFSNSMADAMDLSPDRVTVDKIAAIASRRELDITTIKDMKKHENDVHALANSIGVAVTYTVSGINIGSANDLAMLLSESIKQGTLTSSLISNGFISVSITQPANVLYDMSPTKKPTNSPTINGAPPLPSFGPNGIVIKVTQRAVRNATIMVVFPPRAARDYTAGQVYCGAFKQGTVPTSTGRTGLNFVVMDIPMHVAIFLIFSTLHSCLIVCELCWNDRISV